LPRRTAPGPSEATSRPAGAAVKGPGGNAVPAAGARGSILVVDDDRSLRELLDIHLSNAGYEVRTAEDAVMAGRLLLERAPDLIVLDVDMPFMNGYELAAALKGDPRTANIPIAFLTSDDDPDDRVRRLCAVAHLRKPVLADRLLEVVALYMPRL